MMMAYRAFNDKSIIYFQIYAHQFTRVWVNKTKNVRQGLGALENQQVR